MNEPSRHESLRVDLYRRQMMEGQMCDVPMHLRHEVIRAMLHVRRYVGGKTELGEAAQDIAAAAAWANQTERGERQQ
jgi:hypothetical protein